MTATTRTFFNRIDLFLRRPAPMPSWPGGELVEWERFSFPLRSWESVTRFARSLRDLPYEEARALVKNKRRELMWP